MVTGKLLLVKNKGMANDLSGTCESFTESPMENVVLLTTHKPTRKQKLEVCCKPTYHMRKLRNKGTIVVLIMNYLVFSLFYYAIGDHRETSFKNLYMLALTI